MVRTIVCNFNLFTLEQDIYLIDEFNAQNFEKKAVLTFLGSEIISVCEKEDCYRIHLFGSQIYAEDIIIPQLLDFAKKRDKLDRLQIEVN